MKKYRLVIIGLLVFVLGLGLVFGGFAMSGFDTNVFSWTVSSEGKTYQASSEITSLQIDDENMSIQFVRSQSDRIEITYVTSGRETYEFIESGQTLQVKKENMGPRYMRWFGWVNFGWTRIRGLTVALPAGFSGPIDAKTTNGQIRIQDQDLEALTLQSRNGQIEVEGVSSRQGMWLKTTNARIRLLDSGAPDIQIETSNAEVVIRNVASQILQATTSNARMDLSAMSENRQIFLRSTNGSLFLNEVGADVLDAQTSNARILATVYGREEDFDIDVESRNGNVNIPNRSNPGRPRLKLRTSNGSIEVEFIARQ